MSGSAMELAASTPTLAAGAALWSGGLLLVSASPVQRMCVRLTGAIAATLFATSPS